MKYSMILDGIDLMEMIIEKIIDTINEIRAMPQINWHLNEENDEFNDPSENKIISNKINTVIAKICIPYIVG